MEQKINDKSIWCFILLLLFSVIIFPLKLYAIPAYDGTFVVNQPSGVSFEAKQHGDEWINWIETKDGFGIYRNTKTGNWEYYMPSTDVKTKVQTKFPPGVTGAIVGKVDPASMGIPKGLRPPKKQLPDAEFRNFMKKGIKKKFDKKLKSASASGTRYLLVIGVDYATTTATYMPADIQPRIFGASNSVANYYDKTSYSSVTINPATETNGTANDGFIGWLRLSGNHPDTRQNTVIANQQIARDAIIAADPYIDYASYDTDGNDVVEPTELSIAIIVAGYEASYSLDSPSVWGHQWDMSLVGYPSVDGKTIQQYAQFGERHGNHLATIGIMAHELGHLMFSLPDLYDTNVLNGNSEGIGAFDLMGSGSWGAASGTNDGSYPTQLSAWSKEYLSWGTINAISSDQSVSLPKTDGNSASIFRINTSDSNQYFLLENRQFSGYDVGFQKYTGQSGHGGLVIYHIDKLKIPPQKWKVNEDENDKGVDVEEANEGSFGSSMLDTNYVRADTNMFFFAGNSTNFTGTTTPDSGLKSVCPTGISVTDISNYSDTMTATISFVVDTTLPSVVSTSPVINETDVSIDKSVTVTFSECMDATTLNSSTFALSGATGTVSYDSSTKTATFTPSSNLSYSTTYTATITTGVKDLSGNAMASNYTWSFTTMTPCTDAYEPNDSFNTAYSPLTSGNSYTGKICSSSDVDYFKITAGNTGTISVTLSVPSGRDYDLHMYNSSQLDIGGSENGAGVTETITFNASAAGSYYIHVYGFSDDDYDETNTYTLSGTWPTVLPPLVTTGSATSVTVSSAVLNGTVNANGTSTTAWFDYGTVSASYSGSSTIQLVTGTSTTPVSIDISELSFSTTYYYRIAAQNSAGTSYGSETSFITATPPPPTTTTTTTSSTTTSSTTTNVPTTTTSSTSSTTTVPTTTTSSTTTNVPTTTTSSTTTTVTTTTTSSTTTTVPTTTTSSTTTTVPTTTTTITTTTTTSTTTTTLPVPTPSSTPAITPTPTIVVTPTAEVTPTPVPTVTATTTPVDITPPTITTVNPANDALDVAIDTVIAATFSEAMDATTIGTATFTISDGITGTVNYNGTATTVTFTPSSSLNYSATYTAAISTYVKDSAGNAMESAYTWEFTTESSTPTTTTSTTTTTQSSGGGDGGGSGGGGGSGSGGATATTTSSTTSTTSTLTTTTSTTTTTIPTPFPTPTPAVTAVVTPTTSPSPVCELNTITPSKRTLKLKGKKKYDVTVKLTGDDECPVADMEVTVKSDRAGKKCVSVSPTRAVTSANGEVTFTIKAKKVTGRAKITFKAGSLKRNLIVKVKA